MASARDMLVRAGWVAAVTASLGLLAASGEPDDAALLAPAPGPAERAPAKSETLRIDLLHRAAQERAALDVFAAHSWQPPPPPPPPPPEIVQPPPPPPPAAPPLPFTFLGTFETADGQPVFYLAEGDRVHAVSKGEVVNDRYRIEAVEADAMVLLYLPLKIRQTLAFGSAK